MLSKTPASVWDQAVLAEFRRGRRASPIGFGRKTGSGGAEPPGGRGAGCIWSGEILGKQQGDQQIAVVVQKQVELNRAFGLTKVGPLKQAQTKVDGGGIEAEELVLEAKLLLLSGAIAAAEVRR